MKRLICFLLAAALLLCGCATNYRTDITREEIIKAYEDAGFTVYTREFSEDNNGQIAYIQADHTDGSYIYFAFFDSEEAAKAYKNELDTPFWKWLFSFIYGDPTVEKMERYGSIVITYENADFMHPFEGLLHAQ